ncbi:MAG: thermonuclease family protein [Hyphomicrobiaceae bacterium]|nr:thermonuclease family protein [Hyphomicrobiaceae bacterium]
MARLKRKLHALLFLLPLISVLSAPVHGVSGQQSTTSCQIALLKTARVERVKDNGDLQLEGGELVRLIGIMPVRLWKNATNPTSQKLNTLARELVALLRRELQGKQITLRQNGRKRDRYDRLLAHVFGPHGQWMQGLLLQKGLARSFSYADNHHCMKEMLSLENTAREAKRGLWAYRLFQPKIAGEVKQLMRKRYRFTLVEGRISQVADRRKWLFLNFGENWRDDFTIAIKKKYKRKIERSGFDLQKLMGRKVRVRGWIERWNGPLIKVTHKEQIELLGEE